MPPAEIAELREKVRRRAFLVRERAKLMSARTKKLYYFYAYQKSGLKYGCF